MSMSIGDSPVCVAVVICNEVIEDKRTNNKSLIGIFNAVSAPQLPVTHPKMNVMASITNVTGELAVTLIVRAPSGREIMKVDGSIPSSDPLAVIDVLFELLGVPIEELGTYMVDILSGQSYLGGRRFQVIGQWHQDSNG
ncbi:hypothetical protein BH11ARM1_BH11ARM1_15720 [soil metagenome]